MYTTRKITVFYVLIGMLAFNNSLFGAAVTVPSTIRAPEQQIQKSLPQKSWLRENAVLIVGGIIFVVGVREIRILNAVNKELLARLATSKSASKSLSRQLGQKKLAHKRTASDLADATSVNGRVAGVVVPLGTKALSFAVPVLLTWVRGYLGF